MYEIMTLVDKARSGKVTPEMRKVIKEEEISLGSLKKCIAGGRIVIPKNRFRKIKNICGIGKGLRIKVNANVGTSPYKASIKNELKKVRAALDAGADTIMDLSCGGDISRIRRAILQETTVPLGTVPIYEAIVEGTKRYKGVKNIDEKLFFEVIERQAQEGVDFMTVHAGVTGQALSKLKKYPRVTGIVSRGGAFIVEWMLRRNRENPFFTGFERIINIAKRYDVTLSLGDGLRPGCISDATDPAQIEELVTLGRLAKLARDEGVQVIIEGPGHVPIDQIEKNIKLEKDICQGAPFYVLGPLVTDIAPGYDHLVSAIGGSLAGFYGADFLCFVTPSEHLRLPDVNDIREGVIASRIAGHAADIARGLKKALRIDREMSKYRFRRDWHGQKLLAIDPEKVKAMRSKEKNIDLCTMCGQYCSMKKTEELFYKK